MANYDKQGDGCHLADAEGQIEESGIGEVAIEKGVWKMPGYVVRSVTDVRGGTNTAGNPDVGTSTTPYKTYS